jgi:hypothetical protein
MSGASAADGPGSRPQQQPGVTGARARSDGSDESSLAEQPRIENGAAPTTGPIEQHEARGAGAQRRLSDRGAGGPGVAMSVGGEEGLTWWSSRRSRRAKRGSRFGAAAIIIKERGRGHSRWLRRVGRPFDSAPQRGLAQGDRYGGPGRTTPWQPCWGPTGVRSTRGRARRRRRTLAFGGADGSDRSRELARGGRAHRARARRRGACG